MAQAASLWVKIGLTDKDFADGLKRAENKMRRFGDRLSTLGSRITTGISLPFLAAGTAAIKLGADMESTSVAFTTLLGSAEKAQTQLEKLKDFAARTPFEFTELTDATRRMLAMGFSAEQTIPILKVLGDTVSGLGVGQEGLNNIILALGQMQMKGKVSAEEMTRQLGQYINAWQYLADFLKVDTATAMDMAKKGMIDGVTGVRAILEGLAKDPKFKDGMKKQMDTIWGLWSNFMDNLKFALTDLGNEIAKSTNLKEILKNITDVIKTFTDWFTQLDPQTKNLIVKFTLFLGILGPFLIVIGKINTGFSALVGIFRMLPLSGIASSFSQISFAIQAVAGGAATAGEAIGMLAKSFTPFLASGAIIAGLAGVVALISKLYNDIRISSLAIGNLSNISDATKKLEQLKKTRDALKKDLEEEQKKLKRGERYNTFTLVGISANQPVSSEQREANITGLKNRIQELDKQIEATQKKINELMNPPATTKGDSDLAKEFEKILAGFKTITTETETLSDEEIARVKKDLTDKIKSMTLSELEYQKWALDEEKKEFEITYKGHQDILDLYVQYYKLKMDEIEKANDTWAQRTKQIMEDTAHNMEQSLSSGFFDVIKGDFDSLGDYFQNFLDSILRSWTNTMAQMMTENIMSGSFGVWLKGLFGGGRAIGGPVSAGRTYLVGERGPELFTPNSSGTIIPNHALGGGNITVQVVNPPGIPLRAKTSQPQFDGKQYIVSVILEALNSNTGGIRDALGAVRG